MIKKTYKKKTQNKFGAKAGKGKKSQLEIYCAQQLSLNNIPFQYEPTSYQLTERFKFCSIEPTTKGMAEKCIGRPITYKPDFVCPQESWIIETKGMITEPFQIRWKLFKKYCSIHKPHIKLYIARNKKQVDEIIFLIKKSINEV